MQYCHVSVEVVYAKVVGIIVRATGTNDFNKFICVKGSSVCALTPARKQAWKLRELKKGKIEVKVISLTSLCFASHNEYHATGSNARRWCMQLKTALHARDLEELCHNRQTLKTKTPLFLSTIVGIKIQPPHQRFPQTIRTTQTVKFISYFAHDSLLTPLRYLLPLMI